jgi:hypothetical protein
MSGILADITGKLNLILLRVVEISMFERLTISEYWESIQISLKVISDILYSQRGWI